MEIDNDEPLIYRETIDIAELGTTIEYYENGNIKSILKSSGWFDEGTYKEFYENGKPKLEEISENGGKNKVKREFYENGSVRYACFRERLEYGDYTDEIMQYHENGKLKSVEYYITVLESDCDDRFDSLYECSYKHGIWRTFYENGQLESETPYYDKEDINNNRKHGTEKWYHPNGKLKQKTTYRYGEKAGGDIFYDENGKFI
jgi:antitoxin component YwqK of YwqJK toxin-antitoxin module